MGALKPQNRGLKKAVICSAKDDSTFNLTRLVSVGFGASGTVTRNLIKCLARMGVTTKIDRVFQKHDF